jgi:TolB-like protein/DNA-binding winged helix-turn-helix (wHTH) protein
VSSTSSLNGYRIGDIIVDLTQHRVSRGDAELDLGKLTYELLVLLAAAAPAVVTHDELAKQLWDGRFVSRNTMKQRIRLLRDALSDDAASPRYIDAIRGHGYRLLPDVAPLYADDEQNGDLARSDGIRSHATRFRTAVTAGLAALLAIAAVFLIWPSRDSEPLANSIALLPFENLGPDPKDAYIAVGIHDELITQLAKLSGLRVIGRTSVLAVAAKGWTVPEIAEILNVKTVLEGSVYVNGDTIRISARLIDPSTGVALWTNSYANGRADVFSIQRDIALNVADNLVGELLPTDRERLFEDRFDSEVYLRYYQARYLGTAGMFQKTPDAARAILEALVREHPDFYPAYSALAFNYLADLEHVSPDDADARAAISKRVRDVIAAAEKRWPERSGIDGWRGKFAYDDGDLQKAADYFASALRKEPGNLEVLGWAQWFALEQYRLKPATDIGEYLVDRNIVCIRCYEALAMTYLRAQRYDDIEMIYDRLHKLNLESWVVRGVYANSLLEQHEEEEALAELQAIDATHETIVALRLSLSAVAQFNLGQMDDYWESRRALEEMNEPGQLVSLLARLGEYDEICNHLMQQDELWMGTFDDELSVMRDHDCWEDLARKAGIWPKDPRENLRFEVDLPD